MKVARCFLRRVIQFHLRKSIGQSASQASCFLKSSTFTRHSSSRSHLQRKGSWRFVFEKLVYIVWRYETNSRWKRMGTDWRKHLSDRENRKRRERKHVIL